LTTKGAIYGIAVVVKIMCFWICKIISWREYKLFEYCFFSHLEGIYWNILEGMISITSVWLWCYLATRGRWFDQPCDPAGMFCNSDPPALHSASFNFYLPLCILISF